MLWLTLIQSDSNCVWRADSLAGGLPRLCTIVGPENAAASRSVYTLWLLWIADGAPNRTLGGQPAHLAPPSKTVHAEIRSIVSCRVEPTRIHAAGQRGVGQP